MGKGIGGFVSGIFGSENEANAQTVPIDEERGYEYGGHFGGADEAANRYRNQAEAAQGREAAQANYGAAINAGLVPGMQARGDMNTVGQAQLARALGKVPSVAEQVGARQMGQAVAAQASQAASARGAAGLALAGQNAANNTANATSAISNQTQINAGAERAQAEAAAAGTFNGLQSQDAQRMGQLAQMSQYQATNQMQQKELNDRYDIAKTGQEIGVRGMQLGAAQNREAQYASNYYNAQGINAGVAGQNASMNQQNGYGAVGFASQAAAPYINGGGGGSVTGKADGGPVKENEPYLVGERGPELIVPKKDAVVVPSEVTVPMLSTWGGGSEPDRAGQKAAMDQAEASGLSAQRSYAHDQQYVDPYQRDLDRVRNLRAVAPGLVDDEDMRQERVAKVRLRQKPDGSQAKEQPDAEEKKAVAEGQALPQSPLRRALGKGLGTVHDGATKLANAVDVGYHGPSHGYAGPQLIPVAPPRAMGGPVAGGNPYTVGENGPELVVPQVFGRTAGGPADPSGGLTKFSGGGMDVLGSLKAQSNFATQFQRNPTGQVSAGPVARADGGPVKKGQTALVGERGPEMVIDLDEPTLDLDEASNDADAMMASFRKSLAMGPSVAVRDQDGNDRRVAAREEGGPVASGQPAVVGEKGPEMVVPQEHPVAGRKPMNGEAGSVWATDREEARKRVEAAEARAADATPQARPAAVSQYARPARPGDSPLVAAIARSMPTEQIDNPVMTAAQQTTAPTLMPLSVLLAALGRGRK